jgi:Ca2+-binding RTX toxin-like protein
MADRPGTIGNDFLVGTEQADTFTGGFGDDMMLGKGGNDVFILNGSAGWDDFDGGADFDTIRVEKLQGYWNFVAIQVNSMSGIEKIENTTTTTTHIYARYSLDLTGVELVNISEIRGQETGDYITGNNQNNTILGNGGNDTIKGAGGDDALYGGAGADRFYFEATDTGSDTIHDFQDGVDSIQLRSGTAYTFGTDAGTGYATIDVGSAHVILKGVAPSALSTADLYFI